MNVTKASYHCQVSNHTAIEFYQKMREICFITVQHDKFQIGGSDDIVEVDETHMYTRKYHVGRLLQQRQVWVFGGKSRKTGDSFVVQIENKRKDTLWPLMQEYISQDTFIMSDGHRSYRNCNVLGFKGHAWVNHRQNFVRPGREFIINIHHTLRGVNVGQRRGQVQDKWVKVHTNIVERHWKELKRHVRTVTADDSIEMFLAEFMYRHNILRKLEVKGQQFKRIMEDIRRVYPGLGSVGIKADDCQCTNCEP